MEWTSIRTSDPAEGQLVFGYDENNFNGIDDLYFAGRWSSEENCLISHQGWRYSFTHWCSTEPPKEDSPMKK